MRQARINYKGEHAGVLTQLDDGSYTFTYTELWFIDSNKPPISLTLSKYRQTHHSRIFFPFFFNMLPEGANKDWLCRYFKLDKDDYFGQLVMAAKYDAIGAITVDKIDINIEVA
ncbi:MAG: HipA N-terminal domain-containing protein [Bacteroidota bacterium]